MTLEEELEKAMEAAYYRAGHEAGYWANYFIRDLRQRGGLATAKRLLQPRSGNGLHTGLQAMIDAGMTHITVENLVLTRRFRELFTSRELPRLSAALLHFHNMHYANRFPRQRTTRKHCRNGANTLPERSAKF